jgi:hypothetical protein
MFNDCLFSRVILDMRFAVQVDEILDVKDVANMLH